MILVYWFSSVFGSPARAVFISSVSIIFSRFSSLLPSPSLSHSLSLPARVCVCPPRLHFCFRSFTLVTIFLPPTLIIINDGKHTYNRGERERAVITEYRRMCTEIQTANVVADAGSRWYVVWFCVPSPNITRDTLDRGKTRTGHWISAPSSLTITGLFNTDILKRSKNTSTDGWLEEKTTLNHCSVDR